MNHDPSLFFATQPCVHVVDDEPAVRQAIGFLLESHGLPVVLHEHGAAFLNTFTTAPTMRGVILLDVRMAPLSGLQVHDELRRQQVHMPVLFLSGHGDIPMAVEAVQKGALDFIEKPFNPDHLVQRLQHALALEAQQHHTRQHQRHVQDLIQGLTEREQTVMRKVAAGKLNKVIADELGIAMRTVEVYRARVYEKLGVRSSAEVATLLAHLHHTSTSTSSP